MCYVPPPHTHIPDWIVLPSLPPRELTPLAKLRLFEELQMVLGKPEALRSLSASFLKAAQRAEEEGGDEMLDGERLTPHLAVRFLQKK